MGDHLVIRIHLRERFHGTAFGAPEWPPSPARLFQALVAAVAEGRKIPERFERAFHWLERLPPPRIAVPPSKLGDRTRFYVPNNDLDSVGGDPTRVGDIRTHKIVQPRLLDGDAPVAYYWALDESASPHLAAILEAADSLYQFGRGIDPAWARGEVLDEAALDAELSRHPGTLFEPGGDAEQRKLLCPLAGSYDSLRTRFNAPRLVAKGTGRQLFQNPPKPRFRQVPYGRGIELRLFRLVEVDDGSKAWPVALWRAYSLVAKIRDAAVARLCQEFPEKEAEIARILIGRKPNGINDGPIGDRVRIIPIPSRGHVHADRAIRRVAIQIPGGSSLAREDIAWAFDGLAPHDPATGEVGSFLLAEEGARSMLDRYVQPAALFRSVTPLALPEATQRRRIDPQRLMEQPKGAGERIEEEQRAEAAVRASLRHAGISTPAEWVRVQREPFEARGHRAELFADGTRFSKHQLWHVEIRFARPVRGPLVLGDGRFLGLGVMYPVEEAPVPDGIWGFALDPVPSEADAPSVVRAFRRAIMARVGDGQRRGRMLAAYFSGHDEAGNPTKKPHLSFQWDPRLHRLLVLAPHRLERRDERPGERANRRRLEAALQGFVDLRAGWAGRFRLRPLKETELQDYDRISRDFESVTPYVVNRHGRRADAHTLLVEDVELECRRRALPVPSVTVLDAQGIPGVGLQGRLRLRFERPVRAPIVLGRTRHLGGGLFLPNGASHPGGGS